LEFFFNVNEVLAFFVILHPENIIKITKRKVLITAS